MNSPNASNTAGDCSHSGNQQQVQKFKLSDLRGNFSPKDSQQVDPYQIQVDSNYEEDDEREHTLEDQVNHIVASPYEESIFESQDPLPTKNEQTLSKNLQSIAGQIIKVETENSRQIQSFPPQTTYEDSLEEFDTQMAGKQDSLQASQVKRTNSRFNGQTSSYIPSKASAFSLHSSKKLQDQLSQTPQMRQENDVQQQLKQTEDGGSNFRISENILKIFSSASKEREVESEMKKRCRRKDGHLLPRMLTKLVETIQKCNPRYGYLPLLNPKRDLTVPSEGVLNNGYDNIENDYILRVGDQVVTPEGKEYEIQDLMGKGTFGQVVKCESNQGKEQVAIKVIKNKKAFKNQGVIEIKILDILNRVYDPNGESPLVRMLDFFVFRDHLCIVFELLSDSLYDLIKNNQFQGISLNFSRLIISNILEGMKVIKEAKLIHCDLKPENILFKSRDNLNLKIIDLGSACFEGYAIFQYIQSRYYRSPEVLLGLPYDSAIDMWSLGCICAELFLGIPIFPGNSEYDQLSRIIEILGLPSQQLIQRSRNRDKYFYFCTQTQQFRFKSFEHFQESTGIRLEIPKKYIQLNSLDDLKIKFIQKKSLQEYEKAQKEGKLIDPDTFQPVISESELNSMDAFIDFLKGVLRIDKDTRWTPNMAMEHPFIKRQHFTGPFDPARDQERNSTNETGEDTMSDQSSSSRDSKEYKYGSCPSKILYPQTAALPQYLQPQPSNFAGGGIGGGQHQSHMNQTNIGDGAEFVFHGVGNLSSQSHRPPILSIPDEFFKGFMFGRLDQILSMTRDQLYQFLSEQNEILFRQHAQKVLMQQKMIQIQQQQQQYQQYQQMMMMNSQNQIQGAPMNPMMAQQMQHQLMMAQQQHQKNQLMNLAQAPIQQFQQFSAMPQFNQQLQQPPIQTGSYEAQVRMSQMQQQVGQHQIGVGGGQFIQGPAPGQWMMNQQYQAQAQAFYQQQPQQRYQVPAEQIINPPPYQQLKQQLYLNTSQMNDPQYQQMLMQQQQKRSHATKNQRFSAPGGQTHLNKGKPGSWQPNPGVQGHKYNQYYNQINNPGQIIGRAAPNDQAQFAYFAAQQNQQQKKQNQQDQYQTQEDTFQSMPKASFSNNDFKKKKHGKFQQKHPSQDFSQMQQIEEEKHNDHLNAGQQMPIQQDQFFNPRGNPNDGQQYGLGYQKDQSFQDQMYSNQNNLGMMQAQQEFLQQPLQQPALHHQFNQKISMNASQKPFQSPKFQQQDPNSFIGTQKSKSMSITGQQQIQPTSQTIQKLSQITSGASIPHPMSSKISNNSLHNQSVDSQNLNSSFQNTSSMSTGQKNSGPFLNKFSVNQGQKQQQTTQDKTIFNKPNHHFAYSKHMLGINQGNLGQSFVSNNQSNSSVVLSSRNRSNSDQVEDPLNTSNLSQTQIQPLQTTQNNMVQQINVKEYMVAPGQVHLQLSRNQIKFQNSNNESFQGQVNYNLGNSVDLQEDAMSNTSQHSSTKVIGFQALQEHLKKQSLGSGGGGGNVNGVQQQQPPHSAKGSQHFRFDSFNPNQPENFNFPVQVSQGVALFTPQNFKKSQGQQPPSAKQGQQQNQSHMKHLNPIQTATTGDQVYFSSNDQQQRNFHSGNYTQDLTNQSFDESPLYQKQGYQQNQNPQVYTYPQQPFLSYEYQVQQKQQQFMGGNAKGMQSQSSFKDLTPIDEDQNLAAAISQKDDAYRSIEHQQDSLNDQLTQQRGSQIYTDSEGEEVQSQSDEEDYH